MALSYIPIPESLKDKPIKVSHINGDTRDISLENLEWVEDIEIWKDITYPGVEPGLYEVSNHGRVRNKGGKDVRVLNINSDGYFRIVLDKKEYRVHRLVAYEYCAYDMDFSVGHINHINGVKLYNIPKNLEVVTNERNVKHARFTELFALGENVHTAKLSNEIVETICRLIVKYKGNVPNIISDPLLIDKNITIRDIYRIKEKDGWCSISDKYFNKNEYRTYPLYLKTDDVIKICKLNLKYPRQCKKIYREARKLGINVSLSAVKHIIYKNTFRNISDQYF